MANSEDEPHVRRGWLKNGNPPGDLAGVLRCGANAKRTGQSCRAPAMANGRCRLHGGKSTGPKTQEGLERSRAANLRHGFYSASERAARKDAMELIKRARQTLEDLED